MGCIQAKTNEEIDLKQPKNQYPYIEWKREEKTIQHDPFPKCAVMNLEEIRRVIQSNLYPQKHSVSVLIKNSKKPENWLWHCILDDWFFPVKQCPCCSIS